jgi:hypothetical protein
MADAQSNLNETLNQLKKQLIEYVQLQLGDGIIDIEPDPAHYEAAYQRTLGLYRQRAQNAYEESYSFMELQDNVNEYYLPQEVQSVRQIFRRTFGLGTGGNASSFDPFGAATLNVYLLNWNQSAGGLATYDFYQQYIELGARMFGGYINYTFNPVTKKLQLIRDPRGSGEVVLLWTYNLKPEITLLADMQISQWFRDCMVGATKIIIGEAREKFGQIAGPQSGTTLNGAAMKAEGQAAIDRCIEDLKFYVDGSQPLSLIIG